MRILFFSNSEIYISFLVKIFQKECFHIDCGNSCSLEYVTAKRNGTHEIKPGIFCPVRSTELQQGECYCPHPEQGPAIESQALLLPNFPAQETAWLSQCIEIPCYTNKAYIEIWCSLYTVGSFPLGHNL